LIRQKPNDVKGSEFDKPVEADECHPASTGIFASLVQE
jgi:hypothetical protein